MVTLKNTEAKQLSFMCCTNTDNRMARCLPEILVQHQNAEEKKILSIAEGLDESSKAFVRSLYEPLKITSEDLSREYTPSETRQLCLRTKVFVDMTLFNCVWDAKRRFEKKGRLARRSERFINAMLVKAVKKKMVLPYTDDEIAECNYIRQCQLKKENNCRLDRWSLLSTQDSVLERSPLIPALSAQLENPASDEIEEQALSQVSSLDLPNGPDIWIFEKTTEEDKGVEAEDNSNNSSEQEFEALTDWAGAAIEINTESMTIGTLELELQTQQTESQPIISNTEDYDNFNTQVPATSTQTQNSDPFL